MRIIHCVGRIVQVTKHPGANGPGVELSRGRSPGANWQSDKTSINRLSAIVTFLIR